MSSPEFSKSPLLNRVQRTSRAEFKSIRTERAYLKWIQDFIRYQKNRTGHWVHPSDEAEGA